jgi:RNA polymerase sigma-70 factor (ECF subfamily)
MKVVTNRELPSLAIGTPVLRLEDALPPEVEPPPRELEAIYRAHVQQVARWASRLGGPAVEAEDVAQEVFVKVQRLLPQFRGDAAVTTWLYRITENVVRHRRRKERWRRWLGGALPEALAQLKSPAPSPLEELETSEAGGLVYRVLDGMRESHRNVLIMLDLEGLSAGELEQLTGVRATTLRVRLHRARAEFAARLEALESRTARRPR